MLGILLGPGVLGRAAPGVYHSMFASSQSRQLSHLTDRFKQRSRRQLGILRGTGVSLAAVKEQLARRDQKIATLNLAVERARDRRAVQLAIAIVLALAVTMLVETLLAPDPIGRKSVRIPAVLSRFVTIRYALIGAWIAVVLARPALIERSTVILAFIVIVVALVAGLVPLGPSRQAHSSS